ncbi:glycosyltransferase family 2 protein [Candidatus Palauibacter irciniicola]|uniref:glycosyltransferase family 2 protein n=1 Tax=Candidatus Palauibacter irciniicola TaxID=3056733 RepID=UPI003B0294D5
MIAREGVGEEMGRARVSVVMPVYNEEATLEAIVRRVKKMAPDVELVAVDDGSADASASILGRLETEGLVDRIFVHERNRGKGAALSTGFRGVSGDIIIVQDADLEYDPAEYPRLLEPILAGRADVVYGSRFMGGQPHRVLYYWHYVGNRWLTRLSNMVTNLNLTDMETCYKCFRREVIEQLTIEERAFGVEPEITAKIAMGGWRVYEVGISYAGRTYAEGKKIGWRDGVSALRCILLYGLVRRWTRKGGPRAAREATGGDRGGVERGES